MDRQREAYRRDMRIKLRMAIVWLGLALLTFASVYYHMSKPAHVQPANEEQPNGKSTTRGSSRT